MALRYTCLQQRLSFIILIILSLVTLFCGTTHAFSLPPNGSTIQNHAIAFQRVGKSTLTKRISMEHKSLFLLYASNNDDEIDEIAALEEKLAALRAEKGIEVRAEKGIEERPAVEQKMTYPTSQSKAEELSRWEAEGLNRRIMGENVVPDDLEGLISEGWKDEEEEGVSLVSLLGGLLAVLIVGAVLVAFSQVPVDGGYAKYGDKIGL
mmetsp:Transcript_41623/g.49889  ORF Transcript_41623/g.49889 Transcript_41623/m.49889 type:complete len:208 (+) Transcript_41623:70-693(+)